MLEVGNPPDITFVNPAERFILYAVCNRAEQGGGKPVFVLAMVAKRTDQLAKVAVGSTLPRQFGDDFSVKIFPHHEIINWTNRSTDSATTTVVVTYYCVM